MSIWTLDRNGTEHSLGDWGLAADLEASFESKAPCVVRLSTTEDFDAATPQFAWMDPIVIWRDRSSVGHDGTVYFRGWISSIKRRTENGLEWIDYEVSDVWWLMQMQSFKQTRQQWAGWVNGDPHQGPILHTVVCPEIYLGERPNETRQTNGQQITEVLTWLNEVFNPTRRGSTGAHDASQDIVQIGTIDPAVNIPVQRVQTVFCADALLAVLRWSPDAVLRRDFTTSPVTLSVQSLATFPTVSVPLTADQERQIKLEPQYARQVAGVLIYYKRTDVIDGKVYPLLYVDKADANGSAMYLNGAKISGSGNPTITDWTPLVVTHYVELVGQSIAHVSATIATQPLSSLLSANQAGQVAWWKSRDHTLQDPSIASIEVGAPSVVDASGTAINIGTYPNIVVDKPIYDWMELQTAEGRIVADISYEKYTDSTQAVKASTTEKRKVALKVLLTNGSSGPYSALSSFDSGEAVPTGVAAALYTSLSTLQYSGTIEFVNAQLRSDIFVGCKMTLVGPNNTYQNVVVQRIVARPHFGTTIVEFGPTTRLDASGLVELARASRLRMVWNMPSGRSAGTPPGNTAVEMSASSAKDDLTHGQPNYNYFAVTAPA